MTNKPTTINIPAREIYPYHYSVWADVVGIPEPLAVTIVNSTLTEDGSGLWFMLDNHCYLKAGLDELVEVIPKDYTGNTYYIPERLAKKAEEHREMIAAGLPKRICPSCGNVSH